MQIVLALVFLWSLAVFVLLLLVTVIMHLILGVPYIPTPRRVARMMAEMAKLKDGDTVMDLGAGDGIVLVEAKRLCPGIRAVGCELVPTVWLIGVIYRRIIRAPKVEVSIGNAFHADVSRADVLLLYMITEIMQRLSVKFETELRPGTRIVSHAFKLPGREPIETRHVKKMGREVPVYAYIW